MVAAYPEHSHILSGFVETHIRDQPQALLAIAQQGHPALTEALTEAVLGLEDAQTLRALFGALPVRTVQLRELAIAIAAKTAASVDPTTDSANDILLKSQQGARLREGGYAAEGLRLLADLTRTEAFKQAPNIVKAHVLCNLGTCQGDLGMDKESEELHATVVDMLREESKTPDVMHLFASELANAAAASMRRNDYTKADARLCEAEGLSKSIVDEGLKLRIDLLRLAYLAEVDELERALTLGAKLKEHVQDLEETDSQAHLPAMIDVLINVGSVLIDLQRADEAVEYLTFAARIAEQVSKDSPSPQSRLKRLVAMNALLTARMVLEQANLLPAAREQLIVSRSSYEEWRSSYALEVHARVLELNIQLATQDPGATPSAVDIEELLAITGSSRPLSQSGDLDRMMRATHCAALAYDKIGEAQSALKWARRAVEFAESRKRRETVHQRCASRCTGGFVIKASISK
jgi:tetratricopeptide (TPR) repeat protein